MADGLHRRQGLARSRQRQDIELGLEEEDDAYDSEEDSHEAYANSRCGRIITSCIRSSALRGKVIQVERQCGSLIWSSQEIIRQQAFCGAFMTTLSQFYSVCRLYFAEPEERTISSMAERTEPDEEAPQASTTSDPQEFSSARPLHIAESVRMYPSPDLSTVPEHTIMSSPVARMENSKGKVDHPMRNPSHGKMETLERSSALPKLPLELEQNTSLSPQRTSVDEQAPQVKKSTPSREISETPKLHDYSKFSGPLPKLSPKALARLAPVTTEEYVQDLNDNWQVFLQGGADDDGMFDIRHTDARVQFFLRVPKSKTLMNSPSGQQTADIVTRALVRTPSGRFARKTANQKMNFRRRSSSIGSEGTDLTPPRRGFVAPFPKPLSRENSREELESVSSDSSRQMHEKFYSPVGSPSNLDRFGQSTSDDGVLTKGKTPRRGSFVAGSKIERFDGNGSKQQIRRPSISSGTDSSRDYQNNAIGESRKQSPSDDSANHKSRSGGRARRRGSFVAGSKIEHFDRNGVRTPSRCSSFSSKDSDDSIKFVGYNDAGKKCPSKSPSDADLQGKSRRKGGRKISRRGSFVAGSKIERFDGSGRKHRTSSGEGSLLG
jgi:hypothetical protein